MSETRVLYIIPFLAVVSINTDFQKNGWEKSEDNTTILTREDQIEEYKKTVIHDGSEWSIIYRKYKLLDSFTFVVIRNLKDPQSVINISEFNSIFHKYRIECGLMNPTYYINYIFNFFETPQELLNKNIDSHNLFSEENGDNRLYCVDGHIYNLTIKFNSRVSNVIRDNITTLISISEIAYYFQPYASNESDLKNKLNIDYNDLLDIFWLNKFLLLKCPGSMGFPIFFKDKLAIIDNLLDFRNKKIVEGLFKAAQTQSESLDEIKKVESGILLLTIFVSIDVIFSFLTEFCYSESLNDSILLSLIFLLSIIISILLWKYLVRKIVGRWNIL